MASIEFKERPYFVADTDRTWRSQAPIIGKRQFLLLLGSTVLFVGLCKKASAQPRYRIIDGWVLRAEDIG